MFPICFKTKVTCIGETLPASRHPTILCAVYHATLIKITIFATQNYETCVYKCCSLLYNQSEYYVGKQSKVKQKAQWELSVCIWIQYCLLMYSTYYHHFNSSLQINSRKTKKNWTMYKHWLSERIFLFKKKLLTA